MHYKYMRTIFASFVRNFAAAASKNGKKNAGASSAKPEKQKFLKKQKMAVARDAQASKRNSSADRASPFIQALFPPLREAGDISHTEIETLERRALISKSWSKYCMLQQHQKSLFEAQFLRSKLQAMQELREISPMLADKASEIDYQPSSSAIKPASETVPQELPFSSL